MKKTLLIAGVVILTAGAAFARGGYNRRGDNGSFGGCGGPGMGGRGHSFSSCGDFGGEFGGHGMMRGGHRGVWDEAQFRDDLKARGVSEADITKALSIQKEMAALMDQFRETDMRQTMKERGMSEADITRMIQLRKDALSLQEKYTSPKK